MSFFRNVGMSYLQYVTKSTSAARAVVKDAVKVKYDAKEQFHFLKQKWTAGKFEPKVTVSNIVKE